MRRQSVVGLARVTVQMQVCDPQIVAVNVHVHALANHPSQHIRSQQHQHDAAHAHRAIVLRCVGTSRRKRNSAQSSQRRATLSSAAAKPTDSAAITRIQSARDQREIVSRS